MQIARILTIGALMAWGVFGSPVRDIADVIWPNSAAPWEQVDAFYYPDRSRLSVDERRMNVGTLEACRSWAAAAAVAKRDPLLHRGDYECGVGVIKDLGGITVYRLTVR